MEVVNRLYYADDTQRRNGSTDPDVDPDVRELRYNVNQVLDVLHLFFPPTAAANGFPEYFGDNIPLSTILSYGCGDLTNRGRRCGIDGGKSAKEAGADVIALEIVVPPDAPPGDYVVTVTGRLKSSTNSG